MDWVDGRRCQARKGQAKGADTLAVPSSDPLTRSGGPRLSGQQLFTKLSCSAIFLTCSPESVSQARTVLSGEAEIIFSPSEVQCSSRIAFLCPEKAFQSAQPCKPDALLIGHGRKCREDQFYSMHGAIVEYRTQICEKFRD